MGVIPAALPFVIFHEEKVPAQYAIQVDNNIFQYSKIPVKAMKGIPEKQSHKAICPGVCSKQVKNP